MNYCLFSDNYMIGLAGNGESFDWVNGEEYGYSNFPHSPSHPILTSPDVGTCVELQNQGGGSVWLSLPPLDCAFLNKFICKIPSSG